MGALGILLYELLTGKPPFDAKSLVSAGYEEMRRIIREVEPPKPSSRLSTIAGDEGTRLAKARHLEPGKLSRMVEPDLDWIVMPVTRRVALKIIKMGMDDREAALRCEVARLRRLRRDAAHHPRSRAAKAKHAPQAGANGGAPNRVREIRSPRPQSAIDHDLDWIVMKAIEKDRSRRYETVNGLALDIQRFLSRRTGQRHAAERGLQVPQIRAPQQNGVCAWPRGSRQCWSQRQQ